MLSDTSFGLLTPTPEAIDNLNSRALFSLFLLGVIIASAAQYLALGAWKDGAMRNSEALVVLLGVGTLVQAVIIMWAFWPSLSDLNSSGGFWPALVIIGFGPLAAWGYLRRVQGNRLHGSHGINQVKIALASLGEAQRMLRACVELSQFSDEESVELQTKIDSLDQILADTIGKLEHTPTIIRDIHDRVPEHFESAQTLLGVCVERARKPLNALIRNNEAQLLQIRTEVGWLGDLSALGKVPESINELQRRLTALANGHESSSSSGRTPPSLQQEGDNLIVMFRQARHAQGELAECSRILERLKAARVTADIATATAECQAALDALESLRTAIGADSGTPLDVTPWRKELATPIETGGNGLDLAVNHLYDLKKRIAETYGRVLIGISDSIHREMGFEIYQNDTTRLLRALHRLPHQAESTLTAQVGVFVARFEEVSLLLAGIVDRPQASAVSDLKYVTHIATAVTAKIVQWREGASLFANALKELESSLAAWKTEALKELENQYSLVADLTLPHSELIDQAHRGRTVSKAEVVAVLSSLRTEIGPKVDTPTRTDDHAEMMAEGNHDGR